MAMAAETFPFIEIVRMCVCYEAKTISRFVEPVL